MWTTHARRTDAPDGPLDDADHTDRTRREESPRAFAILYADARLAIRHEPNLSNSPASAVELFEITSSDQGRFDPALLCQAGDERLAGGSPSAARDADASTGRDVRIAARRGHIGSRAQCGQPVASGRKPHRRRIDPRRRCFASSAWSALLPNRLLAAARRTPADAAAVSPPPEVWFSGRRPRCQGPDVTSPRVSCCRAFPGRHVRHARGQMGANRVARERRDSPH